jgi:hypothetical protein
MREFVSAGGELIIDGALHPKTPHPLNYLYVSLDTSSYNELQRKKYKK